MEPTLTVSIPDYGSWFNVCMKSERASAGPEARFSFDACLQLLSQMLFGDRRQSRIGLARQYPEVALSNIYVLFDDASLVFQSVSNW